MLGPWDSFAPATFCASNPSLPEIIFIPGCFGVNLARPDGTRVWFDPLRFLGGSLAEDLTLSPEDLLHPDGLVRPIYEPILTALRLAGFVVHPFQFDYRRHLLDVARDLAAAVGALAREAPGKRYVFAAHSQGAIVAALYPRFDPAWEARVERSIMIGGALGGTFLVAECASGANALLRDLAELSIPDHLERRPVRETTLALAACMRTWPGILDMLPDPAMFEGAPAFDASAWPPEQAPSQAILEGARATRAALAASPLFRRPAAHLISLRYPTPRQYVGGTVAVDPRGGPGDGTVPACTASFGGMKVHEVDFPHTLLPLDPKVILAVIELARRGETSLDEAVVPGQPSRPSPLVAALLEGAADAPPLRYLTRLFWPR